MIYNELVTFDTTDIPISQPDNCYMFQERKVPRVTEILSLMLYDEYLIKWSNYMGFKRRNYQDIRDEAAEKGSYVHNFIEQYIQFNIEPDMNLVPQNIRNEVNTAFKSFLSWWNIIKKNKIEVLMQEQELVCQWYGGTLDLLIKINGKIYLFDFKTSNNFSYKYCLQLAAYAYILRTIYSIAIDGYGIIKLCKDIEYFYEFMINMDNEDDKQFMANCEETFLSLVYSYYNRMQVENQYKAIYAREEFRNDAG